MLRILGCASPFWQIEECSGIPYTTMRNFFHRFCKVFVEDCYSSFVHHPNEEQVRWLPSLHLV